MKESQLWEALNTQTRRKVVAGGLTVLGAIFVEMPDWIPLIDEAVIMFLLLRVWQWAGVDLIALLQGQGVKTQKPATRGKGAKRHSRMIEIE